MEILFLFSVVAFVFFMINTIVLNRQISRLEREVQLLKQDLVEVRGVIYK